MKQAKIFLSLVLTFLLTLSFVVVFAVSTPVTGSADLLSGSWSKPELSDFSEELSSQIISGWYDPSYTESLPLSDDNPYEDPDFPFDSPEELADFVIRGIFMGAEQDLQYLIDKTIWGLQNHPSYPALPNVDYDFFNDWLLDYTDPWYERTYELPDGYEEPRYRNVPGFRLNVPFEGWYTVSGEESDSYCSSDISSDYTSEEYPSYTSFESSDYSSQGNCSGT